MSFEFILGLFTPIILTISYFKSRSNEKNKLSELKIRIYYKNRADYYMDTFKQYNPMYIMQATIFISGIILIILDYINIPIFVKDMYNKISI